MLNPDAPKPSTPRKNALQRRASRDASNMLNSKDINATINEKISHGSVSPTINKTLNTLFPSKVTQKQSSGPTFDFNPKAKVDSSQVDDRSHYILQHILNRLTDTVNTKMFPNSFIFGHDYPQTKSEKAFWDKKYNDPLAERNDSLRRRMKKGYYNANASGTPKGS